MYSNIIIKNLIFRFNNYNPRNTWKIWSFKMKDCATSSIFTKINQPQIFICFDHENIS